MIRRLLATSTALCLFATNPIAAQQIANPKLLHWGIGQPSGSAADTPCIYDRAGVCQTIGTLPQSGGPFVPALPASSMVLTNSALQLFPAYAGPVRRAGYSVPGDSGAATFFHSNVACSLNNGNGDGGSQVKDLAGTGCWLTAESVLLPQQFGAKIDNTTDDSVPIDAATAAAKRLALPLRVTGSFVRCSTWSIPPGADIQADSSANYSPCPGSTTFVGISYMAGNYTGYQHVPFIGFFPIGLQFSGANGWRGYSFGTGINSFAGVQFLSSGGALLDTVLDINNMFYERRAVVFTCGAAGDTMQGNYVNGNFITRSNTGMSFTGPACANDGQGIHFLAQDITPDRGGGAFVANESGGTIARASYIIDTWAGGDGFSNASFTASISGTQLSMTSFAPWGNLALGTKGDFQQVNDTARNVAENTLMTGASAYNASACPGSASTLSPCVYTVSVPQTVASETMTTTAQGGPSQLFKGRFSQLRFDIRSTRSFLPVNLVSPDCLACEIAFHAPGTAGNYLAADDAGTLTSAFNNGVPVSADHFEMQYTTKKAYPMGASLNLYYYVLTPDAVENAWTCRQAQTGVPVMVTSNIDVSSASQPYQEQAQLYTLALISSGTLIKLLCERHY